MSKKVNPGHNKEEKIYEVGFHLLSSIAEENIPAEVAKIKEYLAKENAAIIMEEMPKLCPLAYSIKKAFGGVYKTFDSAYFGFIKFELPEGGDVQKIDASLKNNENILRFIVIKTVRENTMYSPKITVFSDKEEKMKIPSMRPEKLPKLEEKSASIEEIDKSIDEFVKEEVEV